MWGRPFAVSVFYGQMSITQWYQSNFPRLLQSSMQKLWKCSGIKHLYLKFYLCFVAGSAYLIGNDLGVAQGRERRDASLITFAGASFAASSRRCRFDSYRS